MGVKLEHPVLSIVSDKTFANWELKDSADVYH